MVESRRSFLHSMAGIIGALGAASVVNKPPENTLPVPVDPHIQPKIPVFNAELKRKVMKALNTDRHRDVSVEFKGSGVVIRSHDTNCWRNSSVSINGDHCLIVMRSPKTGDVHQRTADVHTFESVYTEMRSYTYHNFA